MFWCCGKVDVIEPGPPSEKLKVDVAVAAKPIVLVSRAPDFENQIVVAVKDDIAEVVESREDELANQTVTALLGMMLIVGLAYMATSVKTDDTFYIDAPRDL